MEPVLYVCCRGDVEERFQLRRGITNEDVGVDSEDLFALCVQEFHLDMEAMMASLVLGDHVVTMNFFILFFPDAEEFGPESGEHSQGPHSSGMSTSPYLALAQEFVLA
jgi:hypothetical protein